MLFTYVAKNRKVALRFQCVADILSRLSRPVYMPNAWTLVTDADLNEVEREAEIFHVASIDTIFSALRRTRRRFNLSSLGLDDRFVS